MAVTLLTVVAYSEERRGRTDGQRARPLRQIDGSENLALRQTVEVYVLVHAVARVDDHVLFLARESRHAERHQVEE